MQVQSQAGGEHDAHANMWVLDATIGCVKMGYASTLRV
jgi:hypothetical protein